MGRLRWYCRGASLPADGVVAACIAKLTRSLLLGFLFELIAVLYTFQGASQVIEFQPSDALSRWCAVCLVRWYVGLV